MPVSADELYAWHTRPGAFERLAPPWDVPEVVARSGGIEPGSRLEMKVGMGPISKRWVAVHGETEPGRQFVDEQESGPFARWRHVHRMQPKGDDASELRDEIEYALPLGALGRVVGGGITRAKLERMFRYRHAVTRGDLERHASVGTGKRLRIAITGASGLVGSALSAFATTGGHEVLHVVRPSSSARKAPCHGTVAWDPTSGEVDVAALEGVDAIVHLAGENVAGGRWTAERKRRIRDSRVLGTRAVAEAIRKLRKPPQTVISASAIGLYGDRGDEPLDESSAAGDGFLADVCRDWEAEATPMADVARLVKLRIGIVLTPAGGALQKMLLPFQLGLGGRIGRGDQFFSWIGLDDLVGAIHFALFEPTLHGAVNATGPAPVTNEELTRALGAVLRRPTPFPVPPLALRVALGEMSSELTSSQRVLPAQLQAAGFRFRHPTVRDALRFELGLLEAESRDTSPTRRSASAESTAPSA